MIISQVRHVSHDTGEQTILPFPGSWVDEAKQLISGDSLGIDILPDWLHLQVMIGPVQRAQDLREGKIVKTPLGKKLKNE